MITATMLEISVRCLNLFGSRHSFSVLNYHRIMPNIDLCSEQALPPELFSEQLRHLKQYFKVLSLPDAFALSQRQQLPKNAVVITIDDGFADCFDYVFPLLLQHGLTATFFISTAGLRDGYLWENQISEAIRQAPLSVQNITLNNELVDLSTSDARRKAILYLTELIKYQPVTTRQISISKLLAQTTEPKIINRFVNQEQLRLMYKAGMTIGAHTVNHPILTLEQPEHALQEIAQSKVELEQIIGAPIEFFAYPNGKYQTDFSDVHINIVRNLGFKAAFSTDWGVAETHTGSVFNLKRFTPWDRDPARFCIRLALNNLVERAHFKIFQHRVRQYVRQ
jgi:peptidoglycan/xylan/chitin deacetylase (PgdA/CDA1 family)